MNRAPALLSPCTRAVLLFGFAGLFGKWLALSPVLIVLGRTVGGRRGARPALRGDAPGRRPPFDVALARQRRRARAALGGFFAAIQVASVAIGLLGFASFPLFVLLLERALLRAPLEPARGGDRGAGRRRARAAGARVLARRAGRSQGLAWGLAVRVHLRAARRAATARFAAAPAGRRHRVLAEPLRGARAAAGRRAGGRPAAGPALGAREIALLLVLGVVCTALAHTLFIASLRAVTAHTASVVAALEPVYGIALAFAAAGRGPGARVRSPGGALIVAAALVATGGVQGSADSLGATPVFGSIHP